MSDPITPSATPASPTALFDAGRLREGRFVYRLAVRGESQGSFVLTIRRQADGTYGFSGDATSFKQRWESFATARFEPRRARLELMPGDQPYRMELAYESGRVNATVTKGDPLAAKPDITKTTAALPAGPTVDQRIDWAAVMASNLAPGQNATFWVYDADSGVSRVLVSASESPVMRSPLGSHTMIRLEYRIEIAGGPESYVVHATRDAPRLMLREELREDEVAELESIEP